MKMRINNQFSSIEQVAGEYLNNKQPVQTNESSISFEQVLKEKQEISHSGLKFSKHASSRLAERQIDLTNEQMERLENGTKKASEKGIHESLVLVDQLAFIVNVPNKTVVTAIDQTETTENIFTNIDGAVIV